jgi:superfamily II DNA or RNA helicase
MTDITICFYNHVFLRIKTEPSILREISEAFTFYAPNYKFNPKFRARMWDGKIRLLKGTMLYTGLLHCVEAFAKENNYSLDYEGDFSDHNFSLKEAKDFISILKIPKQFETRDYQIEAFAHCVRKRRALLISPTSSGKTFLIYFLLQYWSRRTLIIVPNTGLIHQMVSDFGDYGYLPNHLIQTIYSGQEKEITYPWVITTWQSAYKMPKEWFSNFDAIIADECHHLKAKSLIDLMQKTPDIPLKIGFTGSLNDLDIDKMVLEGLLGESKKIVSTKTLMDEGYISNLKIKAILLKYPEEICKMFKKSPYQQEIDWLVQNPERNDFIKNLAFSLDGNTLVLYRYVEKHGIQLHKTINTCKDRNVYLVHGKIDSEERDQIRKIVNTETNSITVASIGCFSEGINIPNINNIIFASPSKSRIQVMQAIGRGLRKNETKNICQLFDIADDLSYKKWKNHTLKHFAERLRFYMEESFTIKQYRVKL